MAPPRYVFSIAWGGKKEGDRAGALALLKEA
jgi:hypothetical protein